MNDKKKITNPIEVMVVEDSATQAVQLRHFLEENGYAVTVCSNGEEALASIARHKPTLVITDVVMPKMDGFTLSKRIRSNEALKDIPILLVTSLASPQDVIRGLECGADNFIRKPYDEKHLLSRIEYILANRKLRKSDHLQLGVEIYLGGQRHFITAERQQILDLLISTYEQAVELNAELQEEEKQLNRSYQSLNGLYRIAEGLNQNLSEGELCTRTLKHALDLPGIRAGWICLREGESGFRLVAAEGLPAELRAPGALDGDCKCRRMLLSGEMDSVVNIIECERLQKLSADTSSLHFHASVPIWIGKQTVGIMNLLGTDQNIFSEEDMKILYGVGNQVAVALERARLHDHLERLVEQKTEALTVEASERRKSEIEKLRLAAIIEAMPAMVSTFTLDGKVLYMNDAGRKMLGIDGDSTLRSLNILDVHPEGAREMILREAIPTAIREGVWAGESVFLDRNGKEVPIIKIMVSHKNSSGAVEYLSNISYDMTDRKKLEEQLRQSQKMEAIGKLAGGIAHDFNNLLKAILGYAELVMAELDDGHPLLPKVAEIRKAGERAASLTRQLLAFSRKQVLQPKVLKLNSIVENMENMLSRLIGENVELVTVLNESTGRVKADPGQIEQVIMNLAINARDAMPAGGRLSIETANVSLDESYVQTHRGVQPGPYVMLAIADTGSGMSSEVQSHLFEPFFTTKEKDKGTGLGLATVYGIVKQSGGDIWVYSEPGKGTTIKIYLPRVEESPEIVEPAEAQAPRRTQGHETILVVEDEEMVLELACETLRAEGYNVLKAGSAMEALALSDQYESEIHLMLTDLVMPQMSGFELAKKLNSRRPNAKVMHMSGYTDTTAFQNGYLEEGMAYLQKPFTTKSLAQKVREVLDEE